MTSDENPADVIEQAARAITACIGPDRKWADCTPLLFARALHAAGLLADPADRNEAAKWRSQILDIMGYYDSPENARELIDYLPAWKHEHDMVDEHVERLEAALRFKQGLIEDISCDCQRAEAEVAELEHRLGDCTCGPWHPDMDGPAEECPRHGRTPADLWDQIEVVRQQRDDATKELDELRATVARVRGLADEWESEGISCACGHDVGGSHNSNGCYAAVSYFPAVVRCDCSETDAQMDHEIAVVSLRAALDGEGEQ